MLMLMLELVMLLIEAPVMSPPPGADIVGIADALNCQPAGAPSTSVSVPFAKSPLAPSLIVKEAALPKASVCPFVSVVQADELLFAALSADISVPLVAAVTVLSVNISDAASPDDSPA